MKTKSKCKKEDHIAQEWGLLKLYSINLDGSSEWYCPNCNKHFIHKYMTTKEII